MSIRVWRCALLILSLCVMEVSALRSQPNIILILADDQGWGDLAIHGNTNLETPNIDRLAREGSRFRHFYVSPVCSPTRAEILTGRYHPRGGVYATSSGGERLDLDEQTLADVLKSSGYITAAYGKWHNGTQYPYHPNGRGFDDFYGFCSGHWGDYFSPGLEYNGALVEGKGYITDDLTDHAISFIGQNAERPFFLYLPYNTPHSPMQVPDRWWNRFKDRDLSLVHEGDDGDMQFTKAALAMCENIDWNVGRIMSTLKKLHLDENTIVVYMSDNGPNSWRWNAGMKGRKGSTDEGGVRAPLIIRWPGKIAANNEVAHIASAIDLLPTLTDLAGIDHYPAKPMDGLSLKPLLIGGDVNWPQRLIFSHWNGRISVRNQRYRLDDSGKLFDMQMDPGQTQDMSQQQPAMTFTLMKEVERWRREVLSELPPKDTRRFPVGHADFRFTQLPARDATPFGDIVRSSRFPNCSYLTNWSSENDSITWDIDVLQEGTFDVTIYYTCALNDIGSVIELETGDSKLSGKITEAFDPPLRGMEHDRVRRIESYVKDFKPLSLGEMYLRQGPATLTLKALHVPGNNVMDLRLVMFTRTGEQH